MANNYQKAFILGPLESIRVSFYSMTLGLPALGGGARGQNLVHLQKVVFLCLSFLEVYIFASTYQKPIILEPYVPSRVHAGGGGGGGEARGQNL